MQRIHHRARTPRAKKIVCAMFAPPCEASPIMLAPFRLAGHAFEFAMVANRRAQ